jgi:hypothetical protein
MVRAAGLPTATIIDSIATADVLGSYTGEVACLDSGSHNCCFLNGNGEWFSKRKSRFPINNGLYVGAYVTRSGTADGDMLVYGHGWIYKKVA